MENDNLNLEMTTKIIKTFAEKSPKLAVRTILKIGMYDIKYLNKKEYAVIDNAVELVKKLGKKGASVSIEPDGDIMGNVGIPGTGLSYRTKLNKKKKG